MKFTYHMTRFTCNPQVAVACEKSFGLAHWRGDGLAFLPAVLFLPGHRQAVSVNGSVNGAAKPLRPTRRGIGQTVLQPIWFKHVFFLLGVEVEVQIVV